MKLSGVGASEGVAVGPAFVPRTGGSQPQRTSIGEGEVGAELDRFGDAVRVVAARISETAEGLRESGNEDEAGIFDFHAEMAEDPELASAVEERVRNLQSPEAAVLSAGEEYAAEFEAIEDEYLSARADDVRDVARQISAELTGQADSGFEALHEPSVVLAKSLAPSETARIPKGLALAFVTAEGSRTSHVSIMARSMGIPAVVGVGDALSDALEAENVAVDGTEGSVITDPDPEAVARFEKLSQTLAEERAALDRYRRSEARTADGLRIEVAANLGSASEAVEALEWGAEGVGLFRTEFLFMERDDLPTEEEQYDAYSTVARAFGRKPVIIRTLDVGGDKNLPGVDQIHEDNPFLGWRGIRMSLDTPDLFKPQLRALLRAAAHGNVKVMFPMVVEAGELLAAKEMLAEAGRELEEQGADVGEIETGVMIETPAAAVCAAELAAEAAFFSIGTNDLVQYTLAADRGNERLRRLQGADHPAVLALIRQTCNAAQEANIPVGVCGEAAGDPQLIPTLLELGVTELSMAAPSIPKAKKMVSEWERT